MTSGPTDALLVTLRNAALHSRIYYKEAATLANAGYRVAVIGLSGSHTQLDSYIHPGIAVYPLALSSSLFNGWWQALRLCLKLKPRVLHLHAPELLPLGLIVKLLVGCRVVYDMHEDYLQNHLYGAEYRSWQSRWFGRMIRLVERLSVGWLSAVVYAERNYLMEVSLKVKRAIVLENKALINKEPVEPDALFPNTESDLPWMLYTGTIAETWGIFEAIRIWATVNQTRPLGLAVIGHAPKQYVLQQVLIAAEATGLGNRFYLQGGREYLHPSIIWRAQRQCTLGIAPYRAAHHIARRTPTRFFEFVVAGKPLFYSDTSAHWRGVLAEVYGDAMGIDPADTYGSARKILDFLSGDRRVDISDATRSACSWETEAPTLLSLYRELQAR